MTDPKALEILLRYSPLPGKRAAVSPEEVRYAERAGLMFPTLAANHDDSIARACDSFRKASKRHVVDLFVASLGGGEMQWRAGLAAYAVMHAVKEHSFVPDLDPYPHPERCKICGSRRERKKNDRNFLNQVRYSSGGMAEFDCYAWEFLLERHAALPRAEPAEEDLRILRAIAETAREAGDAERPTTLQKKLARIPGFKSNENQRRNLLDALGFASILETPEHKGYLAHFTYQGLAPKKSRSSDWAYPVDFWTGKDGLNEKAFDYWFGDLF